MANLNNFAKAWVLSHFKKRCQPEPVEGGFKLLYRLRQAQPDTLIIQTETVLKLILNNIVLSNCNKD